MATTYRRRWGTATRQRNARTSPAAQRAYLASVHGASAARRWYATYRHVHAAALAKHGLPGKAHNAALRAARKALAPC